jgi:cell division septum initiation protein DivIVA
MDIQHLLGRLEAILLESRRVPGTKMRLVDADRCFQLIDQMVLAIPEEIKKAQRIQQEHDRILVQAKEEADHIRENAREDAAHLADDTAVMTIAQGRAQALEERTHREVERMCAEADVYALDSLTRLRDELDHILSVVSNGVTKLDNERAARAAAYTSGDEGNPNPSASTAPVTNEPGSTT